ncbi:glycosyltransferase family 4 protein [Halorubrum sp. DTA98]|uniref:glycosyltransferase family 4 protein n=1 Tax=Halorubrum sp. DTA98 TaxID=3402163 RepID=UPI003AAEA3A5
MSDDRRVLVISQAFPPEQGGNASRIGDTTRHLDDEGWDVTVLAPHLSYPHGQFDRDWTRSSVDTDDGVAVHRLWTWQPTSADPSALSRGLYYLLFAVHASLWVLLTDRRYDVVITSTPPVFTSIPGWVARRRWRVSGVVDIRDLWIEAAIDLELLSPDGFVTRVTERFQHWAFTDADRLFVTTTVMRDRILDRYPVAEDDVRIVPNGVDPSSFDPDRRPGNAVVYTGNLGHAQDLEPCIRAMSHVNSGLQLRIVGEGDVRPELEELAERVGVDDVVEFTGLVDREEVSEQLADAIAGLAPIKPTENLQYAVPTKAYEYLACRVPVVAVGNGAIESFLERSEGGVLVESDPVEIARTLDELAQTPERRSSLARAGHEYVAERYDRRVIAEAVSDELSTLIDHPESTSEITVSTSSHE